MKKKILMIIASQQFRDEELLVPKDYFEKNGCQVTIASSSLKPATGMLGATITPQVLIKDINPQNYDVTIFVGGYGAQEYWDNPLAHSIARTTLESGKNLAAICIAPVTLANAGLLNGKKATVWASEINQLKANGAQVQSAAVVADGKIITASGPDAAEEFAETILRSVD